MALTEGTTGLMTLIVPEGTPADPRFKKVGSLTRVETDRLVVGYTFDLRSNEIEAATVTNPRAGTKHSFAAYRLKDQAGKPISMVARIPVPDDFIEADDE